MKELRQMSSCLLVCLLLFWDRPIQPLLASDSPFCLSLPRVSITAMYQVHQAPDAYMKIFLAPLSSLLSLC